MIIPINPSGKSAVPPSDVLGPVSIRTHLHFLEANDVFEFVDEQVREGKAPVIRLPRGKLRISIKPWGPRNAKTGPVGPWMFACRDSLGIERHYALPPGLDIRLLQRGGKS